MTGEDRHSEYTF